MSMLRLVKRYWWSEDDPEHLIYWEIWDGDRPVWDSSWTDVRDMWLTDTCEELIRDELLAAIVEHGMDPGLVAGPYDEWGRNA